jgi:cell division protein FtsW
MLLVFGLVMVYSASFVEGFTNPNIQDSAYIFRRQVMLVGIGLVALLAMLIFDYRVWNSVASWLPWALAIVLLILTHIMGNNELGGQRWIDIFGLNLQPSEFTKVALILLAAMLVVKLHSTIERIPLLVQIAAAIGLPTLLIMLQPDLGTTLIILVGIVAVAWFGELSMKPLAVVVALIGLVGVAAIKFSPFRVGRIEAWLDPWAYASDEGYQIVNSFYAFADGGVAGVGLGMSHQKYLYLPQPYNDLIFPIIGEELGVIGAILVVLLFLVFLYAAFRIARNAPDLFGRVVAGSAAAMIGFQAFLNMLCTVNLLPMTGKPLPFFSAGGSSIIVTLMLVGLILNVSLRSRGTDEAHARRDELLIIDGGRTNSRTAGLPVGAAGFSGLLSALTPKRLNQSFRRQTAQNHAPQKKINGDKVGRFAPATLPNPPMPSASPRSQLARSQTLRRQAAHPRPAPANPRPAPANPRPAPPAPPKERFRRQPVRSQGAQTAFRKVPSRAPEPARNQQARPLTTASQRGTRR